MTTAIPYFGLGVLAVCLAVWLMKHPRIKREGGQTESEDEAHLVAGLLFVASVALISAVWVILK